MYVSEMLLFFFPHEKIPHTDIHRCFLKVYGDQTVNVSTCKVTVRVFSVVAKAMRVTNHVSFDLYRILFHAGENECPAVIIMWGNLFFSLKAYSIQPRFVRRVSIAASMGSNDRRYFHSVSHISKRYESDKTGKVFIIN